MIFVALMVLGCLGFSGGLAVYAAKQKKKVVSILFWVAFVCMLGMGYLSSRDFTKASMNWIAEGVNILGELALLIGAIGLFARKKG